ncbi:MAG: carbohydrate ABC transporter permease [Anaerolineae bacterium]|uniref:carbohydrate ABC transporter permease n=1 Tax=Candidatus Flexifilum breve TaxID=3140694 RepID=UPI001ACC7FDC|nr:carbohydrate ABC transporter permease [Chloroflexota bacterium]MBK9747767.1 carbohydrate ABC transporter permease [Chloroflexota bacterium]MBN8635074.1 carbohydrate ABC transporter permease [Anaerolineae bacterium]
MSAISQTSVKTTNSAVEPKRLNWNNLIIWVLLGLLIFVTVFPFYWVLRTALNDPTAIFGHASELLPYNPTLFNFQRVLGMIDPSTIVGEGASNISAGSINFWVFLRNSFAYATVVMIGQSLFSAMAAYAFARFKFPFRDQIFFVYLTGLMIPGIVLFIPNYVLIRQLGWIGTFQGMVAPSLLMTPFAVFFMRQFFISLNRDLEEAALLDGATYFGVFWRISLPLMRGPLLTLALLTFIGTWNEYLWPFLVARDENLRVLTVALNIFKSQTPQGAPDWTGLMAGTVVSIVPTILLFIFFGRRVVDSIQFSGFK